MDSSNNYQLSMGNALLVFDARTALVAADTSGASGLVAVKVGSVDVSSTITAARIHAQQQVRDKFVPDYLGKLDQLAYEITQQVNAIHSVAYDRSGNTGVNFFDTLASATDGARQIKLNSAISADLTKIATAKQAGGKDNEAATDIGNLIHKQVFTGGSVVDQYRSLVFTIGNDTTGAQGKFEEHSALLHQLENRRDSISGVSVDEETMKILQFQRAYQASAHLVRIVDEPAADDSADRTLMRVTESMAMRDFLRDIAGAREAMLDAQNKVSSGKKILRPSDNPRDMSDTIRLNADKIEAEQYERNLEFGRSRLEFTDTALESLQSMVERVRFLALTAIGSSTNSDTFSTEAEGLRDQILGTVNSSFQGRFIFGGSDGDTQPYQKDAAGVVTYKGNSDVVKVQVGRVSTLQTQIPGSELFGTGNDVFKALSDLITAMKSGVKSDIDAKLKPVEAAWEGLSVSRSRVGSLINVADSISDEMGALSLARERNLVGLESADLTETLTDFQSYQSALQSTLAVGARISQLSLLDYLR